MPANRSIPQAAIIPVLASPDVEKAAAWLVHVFGFTVRLRVGCHRVQLHVNQGAVIVRGLRPEEHPSQLGTGCSAMVHVEDVDAHFQHAQACGALIIDAPRTHPYGERQYTANDLAGHTWTFSESVADVEPGEWGGNVEQL